MSCKYRPTNLSKLKQTYWKPLGLNTLQGSMLLYISLKNNNIFRQETDQCLKLVKYHVTKPIKYNPLKEKAATFLEKYFCKEVLANFVTKSQIEQVDNYTKYYSEVQADKIYKSSAIVTKVQVALGYANGVIHKKKIKIFNWNSQKRLSRKRTKSR